MVIYSLFPSIFLMTCTIAHRKKRHDNVTLIVQWRASAEYTYTTYHHSHHKTTIYHQKSLNSSETQRRRKCEDGGDLAALLFCPNHCSSQNCSPLHSILLSSYIIHILLCLSFFLWLPPPFALQSSKYSSHSHHHNCT